MNIWGDDKDFKFNFKINMNIKNSPMNFKRREAE